MRSFGWILLGISLLFADAKAEIPNKEKYDQYFEIDLKAKLPSYEELQQSYMENHKVYDRKYKWHWDIGNLFDSVFRLTISEYGGTEKRIKAKHEESLLMALDLLPQEYYQYIGPYLHTVPGMSEKILNMPGIKETKNKFPTRIAHQLDDVQDLEFLSPYLYFLLMPEVWGEDIPQEKPQPKKVPLVKKNGIISFMKRLKNWFRLKISIRMRQQNRLVI